MYEPFISIIVPVYNGANYIKEALDSALSQTYKNREIIVVNDGSNDGGRTSEICKSYGDQIRFIDRKENKGISYTLNEGIRNMRGDYFTWLSHDDLYTRDKLYEQVLFLNDIFDNYPSVEKYRILLSGGTRRINQNGDFIDNYQSNLNGRKIIRTKKELILDNLKRYGVSGCTTLIPRCAFEKCGLFDEKLRTVQDTDLWYRFILNDFIFCFLDKPLVYSRVHSQKTGTRLNDVFEVEKEELQSNLVEEILKDANLIDFVYLNRIMVYLNKMNYKKGPKKILSFNFHNFDILRNIIIGLPSYLLSRFYGMMRNKAKIIYWEIVKSRR